MDKLKLLSRMFWLFSCVVFVMPAVAQDNGTSTYTTKTLGITFSTFGAATVKATSEQPFNRVASPTDSNNFSIEASALTLSDGTTASPWGFSTNTKSCGSTGLIATMQDNYATNMNVTLIFPVASVTGDNNSSSKNGGMLQNGDSNNAGQTSTVTLTNLQQGGGYTLSLLVGRNASNYWAASSSQTFTLSQGASGVTTQIIGSYSPTAVKATTSGENGFTCYAGNGAWTVATFQFVASGTNLVINSTGGSNINALKLTQFSDPASYTASISSNTNWANITWTKDVAEGEAGDAPTKTTSALSISDSVKLSTGENTDLTITFADSDAATSVAGFTFEGSVTLDASSFTFTDGETKTLISSITDIVGLDNVTVTLPTSTGLDLLLTKTGKTIEITAATLATGLWNYYPLNSSFVASTLGSNQSSLAGGATWGLGKYGFAVVGTGGVKAGTNEYNLYNPNTHDFTFSAWVKRGAVGPGQTYPIFSRGARVGTSGNNATYNSGWSLYQTSEGKVILRIRDKGKTIDTNVTSTASSLFANAADWVHLAWTRKGDVATLYINGEENGTITGLSDKDISTVNNQWWREFHSGTVVDSSINQPGQDMRIGDAADDIAFWQRALSTSEILSIAKAEMPLAEQLALPFEGQTWIGKSGADGNGGNWDIAANWANSSVPSGNVPSMTFRGTTQRATTNTIDNLAIGTLSILETASSYTFDGNPIGVQSIANSSVDPQLFNLAIDNESSALAVSSAAGNIIFNGGIKSGAFTKTGGGAITIGGTSSIQGSATFNDGHQITVTSGETGVSGLLNCNNCSLTVAEGATLSAGSIRTTTSSITVNGTAVVTNGITMGYATSDTNNPRTLNVSGTVKTAGFYRSGWSSLQILGNGDNARVNFGSGGIRTGEQSYGNGLNQQINLKNVTLGAYADWSLDIPWNTDSNSTSRHINLQETVTFDTQDVDDTTIGRTITIAARDPFIGNGNLVKNGIGTLVLNGTNTFNGSTTVNGGTLKLGNPLALQNSSSVTFAAGSAIDLTQLPVNGESPIIGKTLTLNGTTELPNKVIVTLTDAQFRSASQLKIVNVSGSATAEAGIVVELRTSSGYVYSARGHETAIVDNVLTITPNTVAGLSDADDLPVQADSFILDGAPDTAISVTVNGATKTSSSNLTDKDAVKTAYVLGIKPEFSESVDAGSVTASFNYEFGITKLSPTSETVADFEAEISIVTGSFATIKAGDSVGSVVLQGSTDGVAWSNLSSQYLVQSSGVENPPVAFVDKTCTVKFSNVTIGANTKFRVIVSK